MNLKVMGNKNMGNIILRIKNLKNMSIRKKLFLFLSISVGSILLLYGSTAAIAKNSMLDNSRDSIINLSAQLMRNLDYKVKGIETASYQIKDMLRSRGLNELDGEAGFYEYKVKNQYFQDAIFTYNELYPNIRAAIFENIKGTTFHFSKGEAGKGSVPDQIPSELKNSVSTGHPYFWTSQGEEDVFIRTLVDELTLEEEGYLLLYLEPGFFDLIDMENLILANENIIILDRAHQVRQNKGFDVKDREMQELIGQQGTGTSTSGMMKYNGQDYLVLKSDSRQTGWRTLILVPVEKLLQQQTEFMRLSFIAVCIMLVFLFFISRFLIKGITKNISILEEGMKCFEEEGKALRIKPYNYDEVGMLISRFNYMTIRIQQLNEHVLVERKRKEKAEYQAMQAKINPHFLYNTLGSIKWIAHREGQKYIENMMDALIYLLRFSVKKTDTFISAEDEIIYIKNYLSLQKMRFGDAFRVDFQIGKEAEHAKMLSFLLQPIVENSLYHGIDMEKEDGVIQIMIRKEQDQLLIEVRDNGKGMPEDMIMKIMQEEKEYDGFNSIGVWLIASRLESFYHGCHEFMIKSELGIGTVVTIKIPYKRYDYVSDINSR